MKIENFSIEEVVYLASDGVRYDLHNDFIFSKLEFFAENAAVELHWISADTSLSLCFSHVSLLKLKEADSPEESGGATTTSFIGFLRSDDIEIMDGFLPDAGDPNAHLIVSFEDGAAIKVGAENAVLNISAMLVA